MPVLPQNDLQDPIHPVRLPCQLQIYKAANGGTYIVFKGSGLMCPSGSSGDVMAVRMKNTKPSPSFDVAWCATQGGAGSPMVTAASATTGSKATVRQPSVARPVCCDSTMVPCQHSRRT